MTENRDRADRVRELADQYRREVDGGADFEETATDMIADLLHLVDEHGGQWLQVIRRAEMHYRDEADE